MEDNTIRINPLRRMKLPDPIIVKPGDIVLKYRPRYDGWFKYLLQRAILFFTTEWWVGESTSKISHAEMVYDQDPAWVSIGGYRVIDQEPPKCKLKNRSFARRIIFRLKLKGPTFDPKFVAYVYYKYGEKYDYLKIFMFVLDWLTHSHFFTGHFTSVHRNICSSFVSQFYEEYGVPCSGKQYESTSPDDIFDYCSAHPELFMVVSDA